MEVDSLKEAGPCDQSGAEIFSPLGAVERFCSDSVQVTSVTIRVGYEKNALKLTYIAGAWRTMSCNKLMTAGRTRPSLTQWSRFLSIQPLESEEGLGMEYGDTRDLLQ